MKHRRTKGYESDHAEKRRKKDDKQNKDNRKLITIKSSSENTVYKRFVDGSSEFFDTSDSSMNLNKLRLSDDSYDSGNFAGEE